MDSAPSSRRWPARGRVPGRVRTGGLVLWLALSLGFACTATPESASPRVFGLYAVWFAGSGDADRGEIDRFLSCLIEGSTLNQYWMGEARIELRGSFALPPPPARLDWDALASDWLTPQVGHPFGLPTARAHETPLYLVFGGQPEVLVDACGRNSVASVAGRFSGVGVVRNSQLCWPTGNRIRTETQIATHEIVETVDRALGYGTCAAGGTCRGKQICAGACDSFVGLLCPGAPTGSRTGCDSRVIDGWVIQRLGYAGRDPARCDECRVCDFTPTVCPAEAPDCAAVPGST